MRASLLIVALLAAPSFADEAAEYARPELLIEAEELIERLPAQRTPRHTPPGERHGEGLISLLDVRPKRGRASDPIEGATVVNVGQWKAAFGDGTDAEAWTKRISEALAHGPYSTVVVYDETVSPSACRVWWVLKYWGVEDVRILNGGAKAYQEAGGGMRLVRKHETVVPWKAKPQPERLATRDKVIDFTGRSGDGGCLVDTRTDREVAAGVIPTSSHSDWQRYVDPKTGRLLDAAQLDRLLTDAGFRPDEPAVTYCRSGGRASVVAFAMELMGGEQVANYWGSWTDWQKRNAE